MAESEVDTTDGIEPAQSGTDWRAVITTKRWPVVVGGFVSALWVVTLIIYGVMAADNFAKLEPNAVGDFLAGAFAPLAFLWLVLGFWQQGHELRQNAHALRMQGQELQNSVEQQRELVKATREQLSFERERLDHERIEADRRAKPRLKLKAGGYRSDHSEYAIFEFILFNYGPTCSDVVVIRDSEEKVASEPSLSTGQRTTFAFRLPTSGSTEDIDVLVTYVDSAQRVGSDEFRIQHMGTAFRISKVREVDEEYDGLEP